MKLMINEDKDLWKHANVSVRTRFSVCLGVCLTLIYIIFGIHKPQICRWSTLDFTAFQYVSVLCNSDYFIILFLKTLVWLGSISSKDFLSRNVKKKPKEPPIFDFWEREKNRLMCFSATFHFSSQWEQKITIAKCWQYCTSWQMSAYGHLRILNFYCIMGFMYDNNHLNNSIVLIKSCYEIHMFRHTGQ